MALDKQNTLPYLPRSCGHIRGVAFVERQALTVEGVPCLATKTDHCIDIHICVTLQRKTELRIRHSPTVPITYIDNLSYKEISNTMFCFY